MHVICLLILYAQSMNVPSSHQKHSKHKFCNLRDNTYLREMNTDDNKNRKGDYAKKMKRTVYPKSLDGCPKLQNME